MDIILTILGSTIGAIVIYFIASGSLKSKGKVREIINKFKIDQKKKEIKDIEKKKDVLNIEIEKLEDITDDTKREISKIKKEAKEKIIESLSKTSIKDIDENIDDKWDKI